MFYCFCRKVFGVNCKNFKNLLCKLWFLTLPEGTVILGDANCVSHFTLRFFNLSESLVVQNGQKIRTLYILWYGVYQPILSRTQGCDELRHLVHVLETMIFHITVRLNFQGSYCTFCKCSLSLTYCRVNLHSLNFAYFFKFSNNFRSVAITNILGQFFFVTIVKNALTVFWNLLF